SVEALLDQLASRNKEVAQASWEALKVMTGEDLPFDAESWQSWWQIAEAGPRWQEAREFATTPDGALQGDRGFKPKPLPHIPDYLFAKPPGRSRPAPPGPDLKPGDRKQPDAKREKRPAPELGEKGEKRD
ncbi:MAG: hypothetical protein ACYS9X_31420, partial [Planctomycetota bacterium]